MDMHNEPDPRIGMGVIAEIHAKRAAQIVKDNPDVSDAKAARQASRENPDLMRQYRKLCHKVYAKHGGG